MTSKEFSSANDAFAFLRGEAKERLSSIHDDIDAAARQARYEKAERYLKQAEELTKWLSDLARIAQRYRDLVESGSPGASAEGERLPRGLRTPQGEYRAPILRALVELGGEASLTLVLDRVYESMKHRLNEYDLACLPSDDTAPRWRNAAQWERSSMREEGLIRDDTPRGTWAISDAGRRWLEKVQRGG